MCVFQREDIFVKWGLLAGPHKFKHLLRLQDELKFRIVLILS